MEKEYRLIKAHSCEMIILLMFFLQKPLYNLNFPYFCPAVPSEKAERQTY